MSYSDYGSTSSELPDCPLIVKCLFNQKLKRISFTSAVNCTFDRLRTKVEQSFSLSACSFTISYKDDDGEITTITNDFDLVEAVQYFQAGDELPPSSGSSVVSGRSGMGRRITLRVQVVVDYDGPSLSDTASLASMDDFPQRGSQSQRAPSLSFDGSLSGYSIGDELDDDAVTVSSRDVQGLESRPLVPSSSSLQHRSPMPPGYRLPGHSVPSVATSPPSPPLSDPFEPHHTASSSHLPGRSVRFNNEDDLGSIHLTDSETPYSSGRSGGQSQRLLASPTPSRGQDSASTPTPIFEQLRLSEHEKSSTSSGSYTSGPGSFTYNERGVRWLQEQNARALRTMIGGVAPSSSSDASSFVQQDEEEAGSQANIKGDLALQQDPHGRFYYTYMSDSFSQSGYRESFDSEAPMSAIDRRISTSSQNMAWLSKHRRRLSSKRFSRGQSLLLNGEPSSSIQERPLPQLPTEVEESESEPMNIPPELLRFLLPEADSLPEFVTDCSSCSMPLDTFRYVCATCGEKTPHPMDTPCSPQTDDGTDPKGKGKAIGSSFSSDPIPMMYPPKQVQDGVPSPSGNSSWTFIAEKEHSSSPFSSLSNMFRGKGKGFKKLGSKPSLQSSNGSDGSSLSVLSLPETAVGNGYPTSPRSERARSVAAAFEQGFELCANCIEKAGVSHAYETALVSSSGSSTASSISLVSSPTSSPEETESSLRRSAPSERGRTRHAFIEKVWNGTEWNEIEQDDKCQCSICDASLTPMRYKCASCELNLCRGCYSQVHEIHPTHAFLAVPYVHSLPSPVEPKLPSDDATATDEQSLKHPDVTCYNCGLDILGARFHCAVCQAVDICQNCESAGLPGNLTTATDTGHDQSHIMIKIPYPLDSAEVAFASRRARVLWSERDAATIDATTKRVAPRSRSNSLDSTYATTVIATGGRRGVPHTMDHLINCNSCDKAIIGVRYQCANCPSFPVSYNLCYDCEKISFLVHPVPHVFLKFNRPVDNPVQDPEPLIPILYEEPPNGTDFVDAITSLPDLVHEATLCDSSDMCDMHERTHNPDHCSIVFKSKVAVSTLRTILDIDDPNKNEPLIHPVYTSSHA